MSMGPLGMLGSVAGAPYAQTKGADVDRAQQENANAERQVQTDQKAERAAGIGATDEDQASSDRDADGRRLWEDGSPRSETDDDGDGDDSAASERKSKDPTGQAGNQLDLSG